MKVASHKTLIVWQKAYELALMVYKTTSTFPKEEQFSLISQMRRAALSVPANISEGYIRMTRKDQLHFYNIALGSLTELECYIEFSKDIGYTDQVNYQKASGLHNEVLKLLRGFINSQRS
ncbi:MAG: four helix bundle protein [bacterium]|nr:four helix bundle protein [bacterium]